MGALLDLAMETITEPTVRPRELSVANAYDINDRYDETFVDPDRERRIARATRMLTQGPTRRAAYIAGDESAGMIPVTVVINAVDGLVTGELCIPKESWDPWLFARFLEEQNGRAAA